MERLPDSTIEITFLLISSPLGLSINFLLIFSPTLLSFRAPGGNTRHGRVHCVSSCFSSLLVFLFGARIFDGKNRNFMAKAYVSMREKLEHRSRKQYFCLCNETNYTISHKPQTTAHPLSLAMRQTALSFSVFSCTLNEYTPYSCMSIES